MGRQPHRERLHRARARQGLLQPLHRAHQWSSRHLRPVIWTFDGDHDDEAPLRFRTLDNVLGPAGVPGMAEREFTVDEDLLLAVGEEPTTFEEARREEC